MPAFQLAARPSAFFASMLGVLAAFAFSSPTLACEGEPIAPRCGRTAALALAVPPNVLASGGPVTIDALLFLGVTEFPADSGLCPPEPFLVNFDFTVTCTPSGDATGGSSDVPVTRGYNEIAIDLVLPSGPPRICSIDGTATVSFVDGTTLTASGGAQICLVEESTTPGVPRLELLALEPGLGRVHPGDQSSYAIRLTNHDATESWSGTLDAEMINRSLLPLISGPLPPGHGAYGIADPAGDHFPIAFGDQLAACLPLPPDPHLVPVPAISRDIDLSPGASIDLEIVSRPWGMCADGSCGQGLVLIDGLFTDATAGFACSGFATGADIGAPPSGLWPDTGVSASMLPPLDPLGAELPFLGLPVPLAPPFELLMQIPQADLLLEGQPPLPAQPQSSELDAERGRIGLGFAGPNLFPADVPFGFGFRLELPPDPAGSVASTEIIAMQLVGAAPTGLSDAGPLVTGLLRAERGPIGDPEIVLLDLVLRLSGQGLDEQGNPRQVLFQDVQVMPQPGSSGADFFVQAQMAPGTGQQIQELDLFVDFRAHGKLGEAIFADGFESGDVSLWSSSAP